jgi:hypothetical protein
LCVGVLAAGREVDFFFFAMGASFRFRDRG